MVIVRRGGQLLDVASLMTAALLAWLTIGQAVSSGCIRMTNEDVIDLFSRVDIGTRVVVLPKNAPLEARNPSARQAVALTTRVN